MKIKPIAQPPLKEMVTLGSQSYVRQGFLFENACLIDSSRLQQWELIARWADEHIIIQSSPVGSLRVEANHAVYIEVFVPESIKSGEQVKLRIAGTFPYPGNPSCIEVSRFPLSQAFVIVTEEVRSEPGDTTFYIEDEN